MKLRRGFVAILGEPNAGKSTLLNALVGQKLAIVTPKPQTTRARVLGVAELPKTQQRPAAQIVLVDTPGVLAPRSALDRRMLREIHAALESRDVVLLVVDVTQKPPWERAKSSRERERSREQIFLDILARLNGPVFLALNKIDAIEKSQLLPLIAKWSARYAFAQVLPISARRKDGLRQLEDALVAALPVGERYFPPEQVTDQPEKVLAAELVREKVLLAAGQEVPYATAVVIERFEGPVARSKTPPLTRISAAILCERESQKGILIGKRGAMLKRIGTAARKDIEAMLGVRVVLQLFVKVEKDWRESAKFVEEMDWRRQLEHLGRGSV